VIAAPSGAITLIFVSTIMANLNEYLGGIVASITEGRVLADLKSAAIAEEYAKHPLLQHFSIPRMRIGEVELNIPVALDGYSPSEAVTTQEPLPANFTELAMAEFSKALGLADFGGDRELTAALNLEVAAKAKILSDDIRASRSLVPLKTFAQSLTIFALKQPTNSLLAAHIEKNAVDLAVVETTLIENLSQHIQPITTQSGGNGTLSVIVEAAKLREQKPENLIQIKMKLNEDGLEWIRSENAQGEIETRLLPE
jgi:hypothetical protein